MSNAFARTGLVALLLATAACAPPASHAPRPALEPLVDLVDPVACDECHRGDLWRVEVNYGSRVDTVPDVLTVEPPLLVGGTRLLGFRHGADVADAFEYDLRTRAVKRHSLPGDLHPFFSAPAFSPDGRHLAYVVVPGDGTGYAIARTWPGLALVWRSAAVVVPATDAAGGNMVRWRSADTAEVVIETGLATDSAWYHLLGSLRRRAVVSADTLYDHPLFGKRARSTLRPVPRRSRATDGKDRFRKV
jgi:hypothetical protein